MPKTLLVVRHCQAQGQHPDARLAPFGEKQAEELAAFFDQRDIDRIVSSPFVRAVQSIEPLAKLRALLVETDERLVERTLGESGSDWLNRLQATFADLDLRFPGGESSREAMERGCLVIDEILRHGASTTVVVTHGNLMALLLKHFDDRVGFAEWQALTNPDVYEIVIGSARTSVTRIWGYEPSSGSAPPR